MRKYWTGCILLSIAMSSQAVSLGRHSGSAIIGRPLDIRIQVLLAPGEELSNLCIETDVFYGDTPVPSAAVRTSPQRSAPDVEPSVRVQSSIPVDEPFVTLNVRAGCGTRFVRRFVILADLVNDSGAVAAPSSAGSAAFAGRAVEPRSLPRVSADSDSAGSQVRPSTSSSLGSAANASGVARPVAQPRGRDTPQAARTSPAARGSIPRPPVAPAPRLQLDPIDLSIGIERDPALKLSSQLLSEPSTSEETRMAAAQLWRSLNASPEEVLRDAQKLTALESEAAQLREEKVRSLAALGELNAKLERSQAERFQNWLVYLLGACLLLALLAVLLVWRRRKEVVVQGSEASRAWWAPEDEEKTLLAPLHADGKSERGSSGMTPLTTRSGTPDLELDLDLDEDSGYDVMDGVEPGNLSAAPSTPLAARDRREFSSSASGVSRSVATEELFDVQQQADFFVSLGEDEQAIQVLKDHLLESHEPSALTYLDLFHIYHRLGRRQDYESLRDEFNHVFNAGAPPFDSYTHRGQGLESYETAFSRIQALWPQPRVLDLIEQSIFRDATDATSEVFDLEAYRELLMLHAIAKDLIHRDSHPPRLSGDFQHTSMQPLKAAGKPAVGAVQSGLAGSDRHTQPMPLGDVPPASPRLGLDIDLDELSDEASFEASLPEVTVTVEPTAKPSQAADLALNPGGDNLIEFGVIDFNLPADTGEDKKLDDKS